jgi:hypothetical protein
MPQSVETEGRLLRLTRLLGPVLRDTQLTDINTRQKDLYGGRISILEPVASPLPDVDSVDLLKARRALADAEKVLMLLDSEHVYEELEADEVEGTPVRDVVAGLTGPCLPCLYI